MRMPGLVLGIDVGSVSVSVVAIDSSRRIVLSDTVTHEGRIRDALGSLLAADTLRRVRRVAATSSVPASVLRSATLDANVACVTAARHLHGTVRAVLIVGGERFSLIRFDEEGEYLDTRTNSSCAAGTGSFLDQQAQALGLGDSATLAREALRARGPVPRIASRCAVFARTDLIHAQQAGHGRAEIADGLCRGLASIVADTVSGGEPVPGPVVFAGGVARNPAVRAHLEKRLGTSLLVDDHAAVYGALGAALGLLEDRSQRDVVSLSSIDDLVSAQAEAPRTFHEPIVVRQTSPDRVGETHEFRPRIVDIPHPVEVQIHGPMRASEAVDACLDVRLDACLDAYIGFDIGSTSTKAVVLDARGDVRIGVYTRTAGRPVEATQALLEAVHDQCEKTGVTLRVLGAGTTGSGRKLVGAVVGADLVVDEITAHARAAVELDPRTDTIIEIGGQDAKFTTLRNGLVTSAVMNTVCAAGTGTFIEEQARQLGVPLDSYADAVRGARAPLASDRCAVFMQRDVNHLLARGHTKGEILSTVLRSVCENYLQKVAREGSIGEHVCFQGATARNPALVAAFEQRLGRSIRVSRFCHLTGALGTALLLRESGLAETSFRGLELFAEKIPLRTEVCELCRNHCKIVLADVRGETAAYGFLCGREPDGDRFVSRNTSGFDLLRTRRRILGSRSIRPPDGVPTIGLPAALYLFEDLELWRRFFRQLGLDVITSEDCEDPVGAGKRLEHAEFCAPVAAWHGHVAHLLERADHVFAPVYLEDRDPGHGRRRQYCYTSQYASALTGTLTAPDPEGRILRPLILPGVGDIQTKLQLHAALKQALDQPPSLAQVASAYADAVEHASEHRARLRAAMRRRLATNDDVAVVLLGRPYVCLDPGMNKGIPDILGALGVRTFYEDMLDVEDEDIAPVAGLLEQVHWTYAARILAAAQVVARTRGLYPVLLTAFKCAPDSFILELFRRILDAEGKPYLVLELDEHDSSVGYETRIEAAVRSFRNHREGPAPSGALPVVPEITHELAGRRLYIPALDRLSCELVAANLRREGIDARVLPETEQTVRRSLRLNTGQCIPLHAILESFVEAVTADGVEPERTALWVIDSQIACNIGMYPQALKAMLQARGRGFEDAAIYVGDISFLELSVRAAINTYFAFMLGGMLRRMACRVRPYEVRPGEADAAVAAGMTVFRETFENGRDRREAVREVVDLFAAIETRPRDRPKVAIFGDLYVRDNEVMNQGLVRFIERHGGEVITTPYSEYVKIVAEAHFERWFREGKLLSVVVRRSLLATVKLLERQLLEEFARVLEPASFARPGRSPRELLEPYAVTNRHTGESLDNLLKVFHLLESDPDVSLFVQANPAFCCPSLVTEAMAGSIQARTGVPVVTVTYDGTAAPRNEAIVPHLVFAARRRAEAAVLLGSQP